MKWFLVVLHLASKTFTGVVQTEDSSEAVRLVRLRVHREDVRSVDCSEIDEDAAALQEADVFIAAEVPPAVAEAVQDEPVEDLSADAGSDVEDLSGDLRA